MRVARAVTTPYSRLSTRLLAPSEAPMARRHDDEPQTPEPESGSFHSPFRDLARTLKKARPAQPPPRRDARPAPTPPQARARPTAGAAKSPPAQPAPPEDDAVSFARAM